LTFNTVSPGLLCIIVGIDRNLISPENTIYQTIMRNAIVAVMDKYGRDGGFKEIGIELKENELCKPQTDEEIADRISYALRDIQLASQRIILMGGVRLE
jgi:hypothetical protein